MGLITKQYTFTPSTTAQSAQVNADLDTIYAEFNGEINDANIAALAQIQQGKILNLVTDLATIRASRVTEISTQVFSVNSTYTKPSDLLFARVIAIGGGGGGGGSPVSGASTNRAGGGGGGGGYAEWFLMASQIGATETILVGAAGVAGFNGALGGNGGTSQFGTSVVATGGSGGNFSGSDDTPGNGGAAGVGTNGLVLLRGSDGGHGWADTNGMIGGMGGSAPCGGGSAQGAFGIASVGANGRQYGGGGGGGNSNSSTAVTGGAGAPGVVIVVEFKA